MRASPPFQVSVTRFGVWRAGVLVLLASAAAVLIAWLATRDEFTAPVWQWSVGVGGVLLLLAGASLLRVPPLSVRWDTQRWHLGPAASAGSSGSGWPAR